MAYKLNEKGDIRGQQLVGETVTIDDMACTGLVESTFSSGTLRLAQSKGSPGIVLSTVENSEIVAVKRQRNFRFFKARFVHCKFRGVYSGIDFGLADDSEVNLIGDFGGVRDCDFTEATLDGIRFFNTDMSTLNLPGWPHVVLIDFQRRKAEVTTMRWPANWDKYMLICTDQPASLTGSVIHIPSVIKLVGGTEEEVHDALKQFGVIKQPD